MLDRPRRWLARQDWWSWDLLLGVLVGCSTAIGVAQYPATHDDAPSYLFALAGVSVALLAVAMAVMAILVGLMSPDYLALWKGSGGLHRLFAPYLLVAGEAAACTLASLLAALSWDAIRSWVQDCALGVCTGLVTWVVIGSAQLLFVTFAHATDSATLSEKMADVRALRDQRLREYRQASSGDR